MGYQASMSTVDSASWPSGGLTCITGRVTVTPGRPHRSDQCWAIARLKYTTTGIANPSPRAKSACLLPLRLGRALNPSRPAGEATVKSSAVIGITSTRTNPASAEMAPASQIAAG